MPCAQGACTELNERAARTEAALAAAQAAHEQTQGALSAEAAARTEAEARVRRSPRLPVRPFCTITFDLDKSSECLGWQDGSALTWRVTFAP